MLLRGDEIRLCPVDVAFGFKDHAARFEIMGVLGLSRMASLRSASARSKSRRRPYAMPRLK